MFKAVCLISSITIIAIVGDKEEPIGQPKIYALDICLQSLFFVHNDVIYKLIFGCPIGSPFSPKIANMVIEEIEKIALNTYLKPPSSWVRHVDDVYAIMEKTKVEYFHDYLNRVSTSKKSTKELEKSGQLAFLDWT